MNNLSCVICGKKAKWRYSPDLDIRGIGACSKHREDVGMAYLILTTNFEDEKSKEYHRFIKSHKDYKVYKEIRSWKD
jgi:hypothetical protein